MKILITGATGTIGRALVKEYAKNTEHELVLLGLEKKEDIKDLIIRDNIYYEQIDFYKQSDYISVFKKYSASHLIHLAWQGISRQNNASSSNPKTVEQLNWEWLNISTTLVENFVKQGGKYVAICGTCHEYEPTIADRKETDKCYPRDPYSQAKLALLESLKSASKYYNFKLFWPRLFYVVSKNAISKNNIILQALDAIKNNNSFETWINPQTVFDFMLDTDVANIIRKLIDNDIEGVINISSGKETNVKDYLTYIFKSYNKENLLKFNEPTRNFERVIGDNSKLLSFNLELDFSSIL